MNYRIGIMVSILLCLVLSGCAPRLPERAKLTPQAIPEQPDGTGRVYVFMGNQYLKGPFGSTVENKIRGGLDGEVYVNNERVTYVGNEAVVVELAPGSYKIHWIPYFTSQMDKDMHSSVPYDLQVKPGDTIFLEANMSDASLASSKLWGLAGAVGGVMEALSMKFVDYLEEDQQNGQKAVAEAGIADYCDLSSKQLTKTSSL